MPKPTIYELARLNRENGGRYFSRENMRAMGQRLRDFKVFATGYRGIWRIEAAANPIARLTPRSSGRVTHTSVTHICDKTGKTGYNLERFAESILESEKQ